MRANKSERVVEIEHLTNLGQNVINFITNSADMLNRTYYAIALGSKAKVLAEMTSKTLGYISDAPKEYLEVTEILREHCDALVADIEEKSHWLDLPPEGLPLLHATHLIGIWGALETFVGDLFKATLKYRPEVLEGKAFEKVSLPVSVIAAGGDELYSTIYQRVLPPGSGHIGKLEDALNKVGLGGPIDEKLKKDLQSAHQIRNVWAHNAGVVDGHFMSQCPYLGYSIGDAVELTADQYKLLTQAVVDYVTLILSRIGRRGLGGLDPEPHG
ncbi:hypothetical protein [Nocardia asteroides]|uniref:hypothetical protein n=1 Tax=Nocardia asteroides TaxID=1824 RepID=UPI001E295651|nr:hypothetical protein [Nocardia asteroides]UGT63056.1 hypothetical protein LTT61_06925 [Nocardia asteroides]